MLSDLESINNGSGFLGKALRCTEIARELRTTDWQNARSSFTQFLADEARKQLEQGEHA